MQKRPGTTITLHPVPAGTTLLSEGDSDYVFHRVEGGRLSLSRMGMPLCEVGPGGVVGIVPLLIGAPQPFTTTGADKTSFTKKYSGASLEDLSSEEELLGLVLASLLTQARHVRAAIHERELLKAPDAGARRARYGAIVEELSADIARLATELAHDDSAPGKALAAALVTGATEIDAVKALLAERATLETIVGCHRAKKEAASGADVLREAARSLVSLVERL